MTDADGDDSPSALAEPRRLPVDPSQVPLHVAKRTLCLKVTLVGSIDAKRCPKLRALELLHRHLPRGETSDLVSIATEGDRTLFFDRRQRTGEEQLSIRESYYAAVGASYYRETRKLALLNASAIVFAPTLLRDHLDATIESAVELDGLLREHGRDLAETPLVFLWLHQAPEFLERVKGEELPVAELERLLNAGRRPSFEAGPADAATVASAAAKGVELAREDVQRLHGV